MILDPLPPPTDPARCVLYARDTDEKMDDLLKVSMAQYVSEIEGTNILPNCTTCTTECRINITMNKCIIFSYLIRISGRGFLKLNWIDPHVRPLKTSN